MKKLNNFRNSLVHKTKDISSEEIDNRLSSLKKLVDEFKRVNYILNLVYISLNRIKKKGALNWQMT